MNKLFYYLPFHFLLGLIFGIFIQFNYNIWQFGFIKLLLISTTFLLASIVIHFSGKKTIFIFTTFLLFSFVGISSVFIQNPKNYDKYYENFLNENDFGIICVEKVLKSGNFNDKYEATVSQINHQKTIGRILLNVKKDSLQHKLTVNDRLFIKTNFQNFNPPMNPHQFDYGSYLYKKGIYQQLFVDQNKFKILEKRSFSFAGLSENIREFILKRLKKYHFTSNEFAVINALLLGQRQKISKKLLQEYTNAGAIHILAISGLHIGILLWILLWILKPLEQIKNGKTYQSIIIVLLLWLFAFIAGLSASVVRAVTMFTFVTIGISIKKKQFIEYSLATSMFVLLLVKPMFLFEVGFQLSYLAVFGIVWLQPILYRIWQPKFKLLIFFWKLISVSIAAQIGVLPISLYYFHQFPSLFWISNLIIIPVLGGILTGGIIIIILAILNVLPQLLADFYGYIISLLNAFVGFISHQETFLFQQISMSILAMLGWYLIILLGYNYLTNRKIKQFGYFLIGIIMLQSIYLFEKYQRNKQNEFLIFHKSRNSILGNRNGKLLQLFSNLDSTKIHQLKLIENYIVKENISSQISLKKPRIFQFKKQPILVVDSLGIYNISIKKPIVLLQQSPKINLTRLIKKLKPIQIIADGSNYKSYIHRWKATCKHKKTPFYYTGENGAYTITNK